jgi:GAF domain-containing protein
VSFEVVPCDVTRQVSHADHFSYDVLGVSGNLSLAELSDLFTDLGDELVVHQDRDAVLFRLTRLVTRRVPGADYAGVTVGGAGRKFVTTAATHELVQNADQIQYELGSGPCVDALLENSTYNVSDLRTDIRWPEFGRRAVELTGLLSMLSFRLYQEAHLDQIVGLNMYSHEPNAFDAVSETIGLLLATHGALAVERAQAEQRAQNLEIALKTSRDIGVAMGILMNALKVTRDQSFDLLRIASQHTHRKLAAIAAQVAETGELPPLPTRRP